MALGDPWGYVRRPGVDKSSYHPLTQHLCSYILEEVLLPTDTLLISYYTRQGTMEGDPLSAAISTSGQWLIDLGLHWALPHVLVPGLGPNLPLCNYLQGLVEQCQQVVDLLLRGCQARCPRLGFLLPMPVALPAASTQLSAVADLDTSPLAFQYRPCPCTLHPQYRSPGPSIQWLRVQLLPSQSHMGHWQSRHTQLSRQWWLQHVQWYVQVQRCSSPM